jgi:hypothetical protein
MPHAASIVEFTTLWELRFWQWIRRAWPRFRTGDWVEIDPTVSSLIAAFRPGWISENHGARPGIPSWQWPSARGRVWARRRVKDGNGRTYWYWLTEYAREGNDDGELPVMAFVWIAQPSLKVGAKGIDSRRRTQ